MKIKLQRIALPMHRTVSGWFIPMTIQTTHLYHAYSPHSTALSFSVIGLLSHENDALPMQRLAALKSVYFERAQV